MENFDDAQILYRIGALFNKYKYIFSVGLAIILIAIIGGSYWQRQKADKFTKAAEIFQDMLVADNKQDELVLATKQIVLQRDYPSTPYAAAGALLLAKHKIQAGDLAKAEELLRPVVEQKLGDGLLRNLAKIRLAAVLRERGDFSAALALLNQPKAKADSAYNFLYQEALGDLYVAKGDKQEAKSAYAQALQELPQGAQAGIIKMKLADLGVGENNAT